MADATLSSSTASERAAHGQLPSFASSFRSEDYERPPPGIAHADWVRLARANAGAGAGAEGRRDGPHDDDDDDDDDRSLEYGKGAAAGRAYSGLSSNRTGAPSSATALTSPASTTAATSTNRSKVPVILDSSVEESRSLDDSAGDRTETTAAHHRVNAWDLSAASSSAPGAGVSSTSRLGGDDSSSFANVYGGGGGAGLGGATRASKAATENGRGGGAMTLREQEKVRGDQDSVLQHST